MVLANTNYAQVLTLGEDTGDGLWQGEATQKLCAG